jgi:hypothetical protein
LPSEELLSTVLTELASIANAAATAYERDRRARPVLSENGLTLTDVLDALSRSDLKWNEAKASAEEISVDDWLLALRVSGLEEADSVDAVLKALHKAESAARMIRAGYQPDVADDHLVWIAKTPRL